MISKDEVERVSWEELRERKGARAAYSEQYKQAGVLERQVERIAGYLQIIAAVLVILLVFGFISLLITWLTYSRFA